MNTPKCPKCKSDNILTKTFSNISYREDTLICKTCGNVFLYDYEESNEFDFTIDDFKVTEEDENAKGRFFINYDMKLIEYDKPYVTCKMCKKEKGIIVLTLYCEMVGMMEQVERFIVNKQLELCANCCKRCENHFKTIFSTEQMNKEDFELMFEIKELE